jgi:hypothetical protein
MASDLARTRSRRVCPLCGEAKSRGGRLCRSCDVNWWRPLRNAIHRNVRAWRRWIEERAAFAGLDPAQERCRNCGAQGMRLWYSNREDDEARLVWFCPECRAVYQAE